MWLLTDSRYGGTNMENALKEAFGSERALMDWSKASSKSTKVAVTATTTKTCSPCIFANYTGEGCRSSDCGLYNTLYPAQQQLVDSGAGYELIMADDPEKIWLWEA